MTGQAGPMGSWVDFSDEKAGLHGIIRRIDLKSDPGFLSLHGRELSPADLRQYFPDPAAIEWRELDPTFGRGDMIGKAGDFRVNLAFPGDGSVSADEVRQRFIGWVSGN